MSFVVSFKKFRWLVKQFKGLRFLGEGSVMDHECLKVFWQKFLCVIAQSFPLSISSVNMTKFTENCGQSSLN